MVRVVKVWNNLPADVVCANSVSVFVHKLKSVDFSQFLIARTILYHTCLRPRVSDSNPSSALAAGTILLLVYCYFYSLHCSVLLQLLNKHI